MISRLYKNYMQGRKQKDYQSLWRQRNSDNFTIAKSTFDFNRVTVGKGTYGDLNVMLYGNTANLHIGNYCSIGPETVFIVEADHPTNYVSTYPWKNRFFGGY